MSAGPARRWVGLVTVVVLVAPASAGCGWGGNVGPGSKTEIAEDPEDDVDAVPQATDVEIGVPVGVERVVDGDSIELIIDGIEVELRIEGFNAPELYIDNVGSQDTKTCSGLASRAAVEAIVGESGPVELIERGTDRFGRTLGDLLIDGESLTDRLIADGRGLATGRDEARQTLMVDAATAGAGIWGDECGAATDDRLVIGDVQVDAPGNDRYNLNEEYVEVANTGSEVLDLDGWVLRDDTTGHQFPLPGSLEPGRSLTVFTGADPGGSDQGDVHHLGESFPVWSNDWETVILVDPNGVFADWRFVAGGRILTQ